MPQAPSLPSPASGGGIAHPHRHGRTCSGHPRLWTWMPATGAGMMKNVAWVERSEIQGGIDASWQSRITLRSIRATHFKDRAKIAFCESFPKILIDFQLRPRRASTPLRSDVSWQQGRCFNGLQGLTSPHFTTAFDNLPCVVLKEKIPLTEGRPRRHAVRWSGCGARGRICSPLPGGLGISPPAL
jgi:hypothetical protein